MVGLSEAPVRRADALVQLERALMREGFFQRLLEALPAAVYTTDAAGRLTFYNEAAAALWGRRPELGQAEWCGSWKLFWPDGRPMPHDQCPMARALKEGRPVTGTEAVAERPDGTRVQFIPFPTPLFDASGTLLGAVNMLVDISDRVRADLYAQQLASIIESSDDAIVSKDLNGIITSWNRGAQRLFGYAPEEAIGRSITMLMPEDRVSDEPGILARIQRGERIEHYETVRQRKDGTRIEISVSVSPIRSPDGRIIGASKIARDITERKRAAEQKNLLLNELKHRIRNTLATVQAIATQTLRTTAEDERAAFIARLQALARAHDLLTLESWDRASLRDVVGRALAAFQEKQRARVVVEGPADVWLDANGSLLLTMALHELATNAVKYGALSNQSGKVSVVWERVGAEQPDRVRLRWRESGGPPVVTPKKKGFGSRLIDRALQGDRGSAKCVFEPDGVVCTLELATLPG